MENINQPSPVRVDLHTHSSASDGIFSPEDLVDRAATAGVQVLGLTDHDSTEGLDRALSRARERGITLIPGVELSASSTHGGDLHLLGYFVDHTNTNFQHALQEYRQDRERRIRAMIDRLADLEIPISYDLVHNHAGAGSISRAHIARVLVELNVVPTLSDAFSQFLGNGRPAFVPRTVLPARTAIQLVLDAGGVPVLAHPFTTGSYQDQLPELLDAGLAGIEVYYGPYRDDQRQTLNELARQHGLVPTGGSDFHGGDNRPGRGLGAVDVPYTSVDLLRERAFRSR